MVKITEYEYTDDDGQTVKYRRIESAYVRIQDSDGHVEEYSDIAVEELPPLRGQQSTQWMLKLSSMGLATKLWKGINSIAIHADSGELILKLGIMQLSFSHILFAPPDEDSDLIYVDPEVLKATREVSLRCIEIP